MTTHLRRLTTILLLALLGLGSFASVASERRFGPPTILETLSGTDGTQALVAAVLVVDEAQVLDFKLAELLGDKRSEVVLLAPGNAAFETLLGLEEGFLNGLTVDEIKAALPDLLPEGVGAGEVAAILLKHASLPRKANRFTASENRLLARGFFEAADGSVFPVGIGLSGVQVNYETTIVKSDIYARNGVIHYIDTVILDELL